jgi:transcriptional regulator with XRE-family HTH domain
MNTFGERLRHAFQGATNIEISEQLKVSKSAVSNYVGGRVPDSETLIEISRLTKCNLHWLLTGEGPIFLNDREKFNIDKSLKLHKDWRPVLEEWFDFEGRRLPDDFLGASLMGGWPLFNMDSRKIALTDLKKLLDITLSEQKTDETSGKSS